MGYNASTSTLITHLVTKEGTTPSGEDGGSQTITQDSGTSTPTPARDAGADASASNLAAPAEESCSCRVVGAGSSGLLGGGAGFVGTLAAVLALATRRRSRRTR